MTHLFKPGFAPPNKAKTACNRVVDAKDCVGKSPECETCRQAYLAELNAEREESEAFYGLDGDDPAAPEGVVA